MKGLSIALLGKQHDRKSFSCGIDSLEIYLKQQASQDAKKRVAVTYVLYEESTKAVIGYYTLSTAVIELLALPEEIRQRLPRYPSLPTTLIGRLAVNDLHKGKGLGELLLVDAAKRAYQASLQIASLALVVDAINDSAVKFYKKYGFLDLYSDSNRLYLPMSTVEIL